MPNAQGLLEEQKLFFPARYISDEEEEYEEYDDEYSLKTSSMHRSSSEPNLSSSRHKSPSRNHRRKNSDDASTIKIKVVIIRPWHGSYFSGYIFKFVRRRFAEG